MFDLKWLSVLQWNITQLVSTEKTDLLSEGEQDSGEESTTKQQDSSSTNPTVLNVHHHKPSALTKTTETLANGASPVAPSVDVGPMSKTLQQTFTIQREVQLRFLGPDDIPEVKRLCTEWFPIEYPSSWYEDITSNCKFYSLAATYSARIIGIIVCEIKARSRCNREDTDMLAAHYPSSTQVAYILSLGVVKDFRRHGIASLLLDSLVSYLTSGEHQNCKAIYLHVLTTNAAAIRFYERRNFHLHNYLPYYYSIQGTPRDGYSYVLYINGGQPPWTLIDYVKHMGSLMGSVVKLRPCALPQRLLQTAHSLWRRLVNGSSTTTHQVHYS